ncbi:MAG: AzlC family ABC transporter permease [Collinsella sp.]
MVLKIVKTVWPVMLTYVAIGAPCGMIMAQTGMEPWMVFALSSTFVTGSGQFMVCNLWLAGVPAASIVASVAAISSRFALYSASIAPHLRGASKRQTLAVAATLTEEAYGISLAKLVEGEDWGPRVLCAQRNPHRNMGRFVYDGCHRRRRCRCSTAIAAFVCTSLFICLLFSQRLSRGNVVAAVSGAVSVAVCKFLGLANIAVPASAVVGIAIALACDAVFDGRGARDAR